MKLAFTALVVIMVGLGGCATTKEWAATGGSRADGTVMLAYEHSNFEMPTVNEEQGLALAVTRCKSWGYEGAEAFGGTTKKCTSPAYGGGCNFWQVTKQYQCTGRPEK